MHHPSINNPEKIMNTERNVTGNQLCSAIGTVEELYQNKTEISEQECQIKKVSQLH